MNDPDQIEVRTTQLGDGFLLKPIGDVDLSRAPSLRVAISDVQRGKPRRLVIDLQEVPYMDSSGVATLVEAMQIARKNGGRLILCGLQTRVRSIFEIARLDSVFTIVDSAEKATSA
jgi:anti-sigma B factor antagonist